MNFFIFIILVFSICVFLPIIFIILTIKTSKAYKKFIYFLLLLISTYCPLFFWGIVSDINFDLDMYNDANTTISKFTDKSSIMPSIKDLGNYTDINYSYTTRNIFIFTTYGELLSVKYDKSEYEKQKKNLNYKYNLETTDDEYKYENPFSINSYTIQVLDSSNYPKVVYLVAYSDNEKRIVYMTFCDFELDEIINFKEYIKYYFTYRWI